MALLDGAMSRPMTSMDSPSVSSFTERRPAASALPPLGLSTLGNRMPTQYGPAAMAGMQYTHLGQQLQSEQAQNQAMSMSSGLGASQTSHSLGMSPVSAGLFSNASSSSYAITPQSAHYPTTLQPPLYTQMTQSSSSMVPQPLYPTLHSMNRNYSPLNYPRNAGSPSSNEGMALPPPPPGMDPGSLAVQASQQNGLQALNSLPPIQQQAAANSMMAPPLPASLTAQPLRSPSLLGFGPSGSSAGHNFSPRPPTTPYSAPTYTPQQNTQFSPPQFNNPASSPSVQGEIKFNTSIPLGTASAPPVQNPAGAPPPQAPPLTHANSYQGSLHHYRIGNQGASQQPLSNPIMTNMHMPGSQMSLIGGMSNGVIGNSVLPHGLPSAFSSQNNALNINMTPLSGMTGMSSGMQYGAQAGHQMPGTPGHVPGGPSGGVPTHRPFQCNECSQGFNRNHDLKRHKRIHLAVKPFPCGHCPKSFSRKDALKRHILVKGCGKPAPGRLQSRTSSDESIETNASMQSAGSLETAASSPEADDSHLTDPVDGTAKTLPQSSNDAMLVDSVSRTVLHGEGSTSMPSLQQGSAPRMMIDPSSGMTMHVPNSMAASGGVAGGLPMDISSHLVGIGGGRGGIMAGGVVGI